MLLRVLGQSSSQATAFCHAVAEHRVLSCLIDEDVPEHVEVHHSPCVQVMRWHRRMVCCKVLLTAIMLCLRARMAVQLHCYSANRCVMLEVCILQDILTKQGAFSQHCLYCMTACVTVIIMAGMSDVVQV